MRAVKAIQFRYVASDELASLFEGFRLMCNDAIRIALKEKPRSRTESVVPFLQQGGDRNVVPSRNIMAALVCAARPSRGSREGEPRRQEKASNPPSRWMEVSVGVGDGPKS